MGLGSVTPISRFRRTSVSVPRTESRPLVPPFRLFPTPLLWVPTPRSPPTGPVTGPDRPPPRGVSGRDRGRRGPARRRDRGRLLTSPLFLFFPLLSKPEETTPGAKSEVSTTSLRTEGPKYRRASRRPGRDPTESVLRRLIPTRSRDGIGILRTFEGGHDRTLDT